MSPVASAGPFGWLPAYDDAYITLTSAQALVSGGAIPAYPGTPALFGVTSPADAALVALLLLFSPPLVALFLSQLVAAALYAAGLWALARAHELSRAAAALFAIVGLGAGMIPEHLFNGLETGLALAATTWTLALATRRRRATWALLGALPFVRPELGLLSAAVALWWLATAREPREPRESRRPLALALAAGALPGLVLVAVRAGSILPISMRAKAAFLAESCWPLALRITSARESLAGFLWEAGPVALGLVGLARPGLARWAAGAAGAAVAGYALFLPSHLVAYHHQRYLWGWTPVLLLAGASSLGVLGVLGASTRERRRTTLAIFGVSTAIVLARAPGFLVERDAWSAALQRDERALAAWLEARIPEREKLLVVDAGYLAFATSYELVDVVGLKSPASLALHRRITAPSCGADRGKALAEIATESGARYFVGWAEWEETLGLSASFESAGWRVESLREPPVGTFGSWWYPVFRLTPPARGGLPSPRSFEPARLPQSPQPPQSLRSPQPEIETSTR